MVCITQGSMLSIEYRLGLPVIKLSMDDTPPPSKKNCVVMSFPLLLIQVLRHPFSMKNMVFEMLPSSSSMVLAGTSIGVKKGLKILHLSVLVSAFSDMATSLFNPKDMRYNGC
jgi:hypothetical protein